MASNEPVVTAADLQTLLGAKEIEMFSLRKEAERIIGERDGQIRALKAECERLKGPCECASKEGAVMAASISTPSLPAMATALDVS